MFVNQMGGSTGRPAGASTAAAAQARAAAQAQTRTVVAQTVTEPEGLQLEIMWLI
jgi:cobalamin biosynthesis protein CbiD